MGVWLGQISDPPLQTPGWASEAPSDRVSWRKLGQEVRETDEKGPAGGKLGMIKGRDLQVALGADAERPHFQLGVVMPGRFVVDEDARGSQVLFSEDKKLAAKNLIVGKPQTERP